MTTSPLHRRTHRSSLRLAARLARRETRRRPGRTLLVALLVAVPVAGMVVAATWIRTGQQTALEQWRAQYGGADLLYAIPEAGGVPLEAGGQSLEELLPDGTRTVSYRSEHHRVLRTTDGERSLAEVIDLPMADPLVAPIMQVISGRRPGAAGEVFLTRAVADELEVGVGEMLAIERPLPAAWAVVGVGERRSSWGSETVVLGPGTPFPWHDDRLGSSTMRAVLADLPDDAGPEELTVLSRFPQGVALAPGLIPAGTPSSTYGQAGDSGITAVAWSWVIGAVVLTIVGIVIAAAFAAGARRQLATLGQLAANGAPPTVLRKVLFLQGTWTGLLGAALGLLLAAAALAALAPHADNLLNRDVDPYTIRPADLFPVVLLGITAATLAALIPARTTAKIPVLAALAGRRPLRPVPSWLTVTGLAVGAAGLALLGLAVLGANGATNSGTVWSFTAVIGGVAVLLGACATAPGYVSVLEPLAARLHGTSRLAARSLARQRTRTGAVVSAVCATSALAIAASALVLSGDAQYADERGWIREDEVQLQAFQQEGPFVPGEGSGPELAPVAPPDGLVAAVAAAVPGAEVHQLAAARVPGAPGHARWEVQDFAPDEPTGDGDAHVSLMSGTLPQLAAVADGALLDLYDLPQPARRALAEDGIVGLASDGRSGTATLALVAEPTQVESGGPPLAPEQLERFAPVQIDIVAQGDVVLGSVPRVLVTPGRASALGLEAAAGPTVLRAPAALTDSQRTAIQDLVEEHRDTALDTTPSGTIPLSVDSQVHYPSTGPNPRLLEALLTAAAFLLSLFVVAVSLALAAAETRDERDVLAVVGAPPPTIRRTNGRKALLLSFLGAALAVPVGFLPVTVFTAASGNDLPLVFPWRVVLLLVLAVPFVAGAVTTACSGVALRLRPVHVSTMAFD